MTIVKLIYNQQELPVDREKLAQSCKYFHCLLMGDFREAKEREVEICLDTDCISFDLFKAAIEFAITDQLPDDREANFYAGLIQLANIWLYDHMVHVVEEKLLEFVNRRYLPHLHTLANVLKLTKLAKACEAFEVNLGSWAGSEPKKWPGCAFPLHKRRHHYSRCTGFMDKQTPLPEAENWDEL